MAFFEEVVLPHSGEDCLAWPYARTLGYGYLYVEGSVRGVHRLVCERLYGPAPSPQHQAAHSCGNGHLGCVNPRHLSWKTRSENEADKITHGTDPRGEKCGTNKLSEADIREIRALRGKQSQKSLAVRFGVDQSHICRIQAGANWAWLR